MISCCPKTSDAFVVAVLLQCVSTCYDDDVAPSSLFGGFGCSGVLCQLKGQAKKGGVSILDPQDVFLNADDIFSS